MYVASFLTFMTIGGFPSFVEDMKVSFFLFPFRSPPSSFNQFNADL